MFFKYTVNLAAMTTGYYKKRRDYLFGEPIVSLLTIHDNIIYL